MSIGFNGARILDSMSALTDENQMRELLKTLKKESLEEHGEQSIDTIPFDYFQPSNSQHVALFVQRKIDVLIEESKKEGTLSQLLERIEAVATRIGLLKTLFSNGSDDQDTLNKICDNFQSHIEDLGDELDKQPKKRVDSFSYEGFVNMSSSASRERSGEEHIETFSFSDFCSKTPPALHQSISQPTTVESERGLSSSTESSHKSLERTPPAPIAKLGYFAYASKLTRTALVMGASTIKPNDSRSLVSNYDEIPPPIKHTVNSLIEKSGSFLGTQAVRCFISYLRALDSSNSFDVIQDLLGQYPDSSTPLTALLIRLADYDSPHSLFKKGDLLFIPWFLRTGSGHITLITIDFKNKNIEFYDSLYGINEWNFSIPDLLTKMKKLCFNESEEIENLDNAGKHQKDLHNCGVFVCYHMEQRILGKSSKELTLEDWSDSNKIERIRIEIAQKIASVPSFE